MTTPDKDQVTSSTPEPEEAAPAAASPADGTAPAEVIADAEVIEANEAGQLDEELEKAAAEKGVPVVSAGIAGLTGWCKAIFPGETGPASLLAGEGDRPTPDEILGNLAPTVFLAASLQAALVLQILTGKPVRREALFFDLEDGTFTQVVLDRRP